MKKSARKKNTKKCETQQNKTFRIKNGGSSPIGAPLYPPTIVSNEPYYSVNTFNQNNCLDIIKNNKINKTSLFNKNTSINCLRTLRIMNILTLTYTDYLKYLTIVKSYYENPLYFKIENGKHFYYNEKLPDTEVYKIQFIGTTFLNDSINNIINKNRLDSLLNHIQPHYYLYLIDPNTNIPPQIKRQIYQRMSDIFIISTFSDFQKLLMEYYSIPNPFALKTLGSMYRPIPKVTNVTNIPDSNYMWNPQIVQQAPLDIDYINTSGEINIIDNDYNTIDIESLFNRTDSESFSRGSNPIYIIDKGEKNLYSTLDTDTPTSERQDVFNKFKQQINSYDNTIASKILIALKFSLTLSMHELMSIGAGINHQTGPFTKLYQDSKLDDNQDLDTDPPYLFMVIQNDSFKLDPSNKNSIISIISHKIPSYFDVYSQKEFIDNNKFPTLRIYNSQSNTLISIAFGVCMLLNIRVGINMQIMEIKNINNENGTNSKPMMLYINNYQFFDILDQDEQEEVKNNYPKIYNGFYKYLWVNMTHHDAMKQVAPIDVTITGGWVPDSLKPGLSTLGIRNISNIEEIKDCNISPTATPRLFKILNPLKEYMPEMYDYYYPLDTDSEEIKQQKCDTLNELRRLWIQYKQTNSEVINKMPRAIITRKLGIPSDSTRYFQFLRDNFCSLEAEESRVPLGCNIKYY